MTSRAKIAQLSSLIRAKRKDENLGLREAAKISGVSPSTLSRLERNISSSLPDLETLTRLATWLNVSIDTILGEQDLIRDDHPVNLDTIDKIELHLRADKDLKPETAEALATMFRTLYNKFHEMQDSVT